MPVPESSRPPSRLQASAALLLIVGAAAWAWRLAFESGPWPQSAATLIAAEIVLMTTIVVVALVLSPLPWVRNTATVLVAGELALAMALDTSPAWWVAVVTSTIGTILLWRPGLTEAIEQGVRPDRVPARATALAIGLALLPGVVGVLGYDGVTVGGWVLAGAALVLAWAYMRALPIALWTVRLVLAPLSIWAAIGLDPVAGVALVGATLVLVGLAWTSDARNAVSPLAPERGKPVPLLPEMVPGEILESAGFDQRGRPRKKGS
jgi:hypothetical protein